MVFKRFHNIVLFKVILLAGSIFLANFFLFREQYLLMSILLFIAVLQIYALIGYINLTNRKLARFFDSIRYSDFTSSFKTDHKLGKSFRELNEVFNDVLQAFRKTRAESQESLQYLNTIVQHVPIGLFAYDHTGKVQLVNPTARRYLGGGPMKNIQDLSVNKPSLYHAIEALRTGKRVLFRENDQVHLAIQATGIKLQSSYYKLVSLQNIQSELQQNEVESWQNLTRVLRHEIMNSATPIASLTSTVNDILKSEVEPKNGYYTFPADVYEDIKDSLQTIEARTNGLIDFVNAYRNFTSIPQPVYNTFKLLTLITRIHTLLKGELQTAGVALQYNIKPENITIQGDRDLLEMALLNIVRNAMEAVQGSSNPQISINGGRTMDNHIFLEIKDNGPGIPEGVREKIFIPFFSTKNNGSGIGLSLARQIIQMHKGRVTVDSKEGAYTCFMVVI